MAKLVTGKTLANGAAKLEKLPDRLKIFNWGSNPTLKGTVTVNDKTVRLFQDNQKKSGREVFPLDFEHNTVPGTTEYKRTTEPRPVAGHFTAEIIPNDGVYILTKDWTESGEQNARNFMDLSPAPIVDDEGVLIGLHSVALTQTGAVQELTFLNCEKTNPIYGTLMLLSASAGDLIPEDKNTNSKNNMDKDTLAVMRKVMSMEDEPDDGAVLTAFSKAVTDGTLKNSPIQKDFVQLAGGGKATVLSAEDLEAVVENAVKKFTAPLTLSVTEITTAKLQEKKDMETAARATLVAQASHDGKVIPLSADEIATIPVAALTSLVKGLPKTINMRRSTTPEVKRGAQGHIDTSVPAGAKLVVLNADGTTTPYTPKQTNDGSARANTVALFNEQLASLNGRN